MSKILRVNMTDRTTKTEDLPEKYKLFGGRALTSNIVADEVPADCHALGPSNKLAFAPGIVTGTAKAPPVVYVGPSQIKQMKAGAVIASGLPVP